MEKEEYFTHLFFLLAREPHILSCLTVCFSNIVLNTKEGEKFSLKVDKNIKSHYENSLACTILMDEIFPNLESCSIDEILSCDNSILERINRFLSFTFEVYDHLDVKYPCSFLPRITKRDSFYREGVDEFDDERIWETPMKREKRSTTCVGCKKSAGLIMHDVTLCWKCKKSMCFNCCEKSSLEHVVKERKMDGRDELIRSDHKDDSNFLLFYMKRHKKESILEFTKCLNCSASLGLSSIPKVHYLIFCPNQLEFFLRKFTESSILLEEEIFTCFGIAKKAMEEGYNEAAADYCTRIINSFSLMNSYLPGFMDFVQKIGLMKAHYLRARAEGMSHLVSYYKNLFDHFRRKLFPVNDFESSFISKEDLVRVSRVSMENPTLAQRHQFRFLQTPEGLDLDFDKKRPTDDVRHRGFEYDIKKLPQLSFCKMEGSRRHGVEHTLLFRVQGKQICSLTIYDAKYTFNSSFDANGFMDLTLESNILEVDREHANRLHFKCLDDNANRYVAYESASMGDKMMKDAMKKKNPYIQAHAKGNESDSSVCGIWMPIRWDRRTLRTTRKAVNH